MRFEKAVAIEADDWRSLKLRIQKAFSVGDERTFDQDPRFGLSVMAEIASRALSPAVNDPGTAIDVIGRLVRLLSDWQRRGHDGVVQGEEALAYPRVRVSALATSDLIEDAFLPIARDGAGLVEVQIRLQKSLEALARIGTEDCRQAVAAVAAVCLAHAEQGLPLESERERVREAAGW